MNINFQWWPAFVISKLWWVECSLSSLKCNCIYATIVNLNILKTCDIESTYFDCQSLLYTVCPVEEFKLRNKLCSQSEEWTLLTAATSHVNCGKLYTHITLTLLVALACNISCVCTPKVIPEHHRQKKGSPPDLKSKWVGETDYTNTKRTSSSQFSKLAVRLYKAIG